MVGSKGCGVERVSIWSHGVHLSKKAASVDQSCRCQLHNYWDVTVQKLEG